MPVLELSFASGESSLSVRRFTLHEAISTPFTVSVWARSSTSNLDLESIVGKGAVLTIQSGVAFARSAGRTFGGVVSHVEQVQAEPTGLSTYYLRIVPTLWLLNQRRNYRIFQHLTIPEIVGRVLSEWSIEPVWRIDAERYPELEYKVQYGESDFTFVSRLLEEAGIAYVFEDEEGETQLVFSDALHKSEIRAGGPVPSVDNPNQESEQEFVTRVRLSHEVKPGARTLRDYDFRRPGFGLFGEASVSMGPQAAPNPGPAGQAPKSAPPEDRYEQYEYRPGGFLVEGGRAGGNTPTADDKGVARHDQAAGHARAERMLLSDRAGKRALGFDHNLLDLHAGMVFAIGHHPHPEITEETRLLVVETSIEGSPGGEWTFSGQALFAAIPYRPLIKTPKPEVSGVQSATVVGPGGEEIHTDEFGRVRVQFPWDREGKMDDESSCWMRVSQGWAGTGYGLITIPRIGQEVLVGFLSGDPDQPIIVGRVFNAVQQVPYRLPQHKTRSTWKSDSSPGSDGFNEIMFEDLKHQELVWMQAQKNLRKLVKNDESLTVGRDRRKYVMRNELETTGANRTEITGANRTEVTGANRVTVVGANDEKLIKGSEVEKTGGDLTVLVGGDQDIVIRESKRERVEGESHLVVNGRRAQRIDGKQSLYVGKDRHEKVGKSHLMSAGKTIHVKAGTAIVVEAPDITFKGPGGFVRIDEGGVTIQGTVVKINSGGEAGTAPEAKPDKPAAAIDSIIEEPPIPDPDNLFTSGIGQ